ncbi:PREDICTED: uncharacterized protein C8orf76-like [Calidris pugnax]|uniref:uncharacterized protein C8orf76-like n=1 Tax=Calidris pugnax TaxID=198806 RepID=UPI00071CFC2F|nr:PREDICTED: uncharacterized protein C8orf76-like [Calidris pugnax]
MTCSEMKEVTIKLQPPCSQYTAKGSGSNTGFASELIRLLCLQRKTDGFGEHVQAALTVLTYLDAGYGRTRTTFQLTFSKPTGRSDGTKWTFLDGWTGKAERDLGPNSSPKPGAGGGDPRRRRCHPPPPNEGQTPGTGAAGPLGSPLLGWQFEDSLFAPSRERGLAGGAGPAGGAKHCEPGWFRSGEDSGEGDGGITASKFRADWAYRQREFEKALCEYSNCLLLLPASNIAMRRDVQEGQARCLSHLGRHKEALDIAETMRNGATNTDHLTTVLNLQFAIYQGLEDVEKKITCLQQLICLHPFNPWYWKSLAEAYMSLLQSLSPLVIPETNVNQSEEVTVSDSSFKTSTEREINLQPRRSDGQNEGPRPSLATETKRENAVTCSSGQEPERMNEGKSSASESWEQNTSKKVGIKACASFIRARLLLQLTQSQQSSFALESNIKSQKEIDDKVAPLGFSENSLLLMTKVMGQDLIPEKLKEEFQGEVKCIGPSALSSLVTASAAEFEMKWFGNLHDDLCHFDSQFSSDIYLTPLVT